MSSEKRDGSTVDGIKTNGNAEDTIPLKDAENSIAKESGSATIEIPEQSTKEKRSKFMGSYHEALRSLEITEKSRTPFLILVSICILLVIVLVIMIALWPSIPSHLKAPLCKTKHCLSASVQHSSLVDREQTPCTVPYDWACGKFSEQFRDHELSGRFRGEWNQQNHFKYEEIAKINNFITRSLINTTGSGVYIKELYNSCLNSDKAGELSSTLHFKKLIRAIGGWQLQDDAISNWTLKRWSIQEVLPIVQSRYGVSLFYKVHVIDRSTVPLGKIIAIGEGDLGLPHKDLYMVDPNSKIVHAYKELLQNTVKLFGRTSEEARRFADVIYNFERRVVNDAFYVHRDEVKGEVIRLGKLKMELPSLALYETISAMFPKTKDTTEVWVEDLERLKALSRLVSSTDSSLLNDIAVWSTLVKLSPFTSSETRKIWDQYQHEIYGVNENEPIWYKCTSFVNQLVPVAIEVLRHNPTTSEELEYVNELFNLVRKTLIDEIERVLWIEQELSVFLIRKLQQTTLQIGIPQEILKDDTFLEKYYVEFFPQTSFIENFEVFWAFEKSLMIKELGEFEEHDEILFNLFPTSRSQKDDVSYSVELNKILIRSSVIKSEYFNTKYSISTNFARLGVDLANALIKATQSLSHYYPASDPLPYQSESSSTFQCLQFEAPLHLTPIEAQQNMLLSVSATNIATTAFERLLRNLRKGREIPSALALRDEIPRLPGLQEYSEKQLFDLVLLQKHCGITTGSYSMAKPFFERHFPKEDEFTNVWRSLNPDDFECDVNKLQCQNVF